ncbi:hypothetical protein ACFOWE_32875 [Planomonospora corallina]|uniref:Uncharacterized protein n=1 Tax=Planomonospora corallina TaxID=1806052 RepID=A0ABV8IJF2_9ACTN
MLFIGLIVGMGGPPLWSYPLLPPSSLLILLPLGLLAGLTTRYDSRRPWVRITVFTLEGVVILSSLLFLRGPSPYLGALPGSVLGVAVVFWLTRPAARSWFGG